MERQHIEDSAALAEHIRVALEGLKALDIQVMDLRERNTFADFFILATGTSQRHVAALADEVDKAAWQAKNDILGTEGLPEAKWVLVDLDVVVVHLFQAETRGFYSLEKLWSSAPARPRPNKDTAEAGDSAPGREPREA